MKRLVLFLALLLVASFGGCTNNNSNDDLTDTITTGTWRVSYYIENNDDDTVLFYGYVFTFRPDGTVSVTRPSLPVAPGTWNEHDSDRRLDLDFGVSGLLEKLNEDWVVISVDNDVVLLNEPGHPLNQCEFARIF
jgi:hypothetical protein